MRGNEHAIRVIFDVNVLFSSAINEDGVPARCVRLVTSACLAQVTSNVILNTLERKLREKAILSQTAIDKLTTAIRLASLVVPSEWQPPRITADPEDDAVLATAVAGGATHLITGDRRHLLPLGEYRGVRIQTPRQFLDEHERSLTAVEP